MSYNKVVLIGFSGKDADVKTFDSGSIVANFTLATSERGYKLPNGTEVPESTDWHNIICVGNQAKFAEKWVKKGTGLLIEGKIRYRQYETKQGEKRFVTEILADRIEFFSFGKKSQSDQQSNVNKNSNQDNEVYQSQPSYEQQVQGADDLPF